MDLSQYSYRGKKDNDEKSQSKLDSPKKRRSLLMKDQSKPICDPLKTLDIICDFRKNNQAPVDTMGCERLFDPETTPQIKKFQVLTSIILSIQTKDEISDRCVKKLLQFGLSPQKISKMSEEELIPLIKQCNFHKRKAKNIIEISKIFMENGPPKNMEEVLRLPGVGEKVGVIYMKVGEGQNVGIGVDTHVHRISNKLGWVNTPTPNKTESALQQIFAKSEWRRINMALVGFGQIICDAKKPKCQICPVRTLCPSAQQLF